MKTTNETQYVIYDNSANRKPYIAESFENTGDPDSAMKFESLEEAQELIDRMGWNNWAFVLEI
jgi:hypothetical protein